jgi:DNA-binding response OmpR family regulator
MDVEGRWVMEQIGVTAGRTRPAVIGLTRRGDLKTKLAALEWGADDILRSRSRSRSCLLG